MNHQSGNIQECVVGAPPLTPLHHSTPMTAQKVSHTLDVITLNKGEEDQLECLGYQRSWWKSILFIICCLLSLGLAFLVTHWKPYWRLILTRSRCPLAQADTVLLVDELGHHKVEHVVKQPLTDGPRGYRSCTVPNGSPYAIEPNSKTGLSQYEFVDNGPGCASDMDDRTVLTVRPRVFLKFFLHKHVKYIWDNELRAFKKLRGLDVGFTCAEIHEQFQGLTPDEQQTKLMLYGRNSIDIDVKSYPRLFIEEVVNPFYIFQICSVVLWSLDDYYIYASCIVFISLISLSVELYETHKQMVTLRDMVVAHDSMVTVLTLGGSTVEVLTSQLVPGDVLLVPARGCMMTCDAVLVSGNAIVNESMLTGESVPVTKTPLVPDEASDIYSPDVHKRHTLFCGTQVIQTRYYGDAKVKAVVVRTGFSTSKGELVRAILFPKPIGFKFYQDSMKFIGFLAIIAACGMIYSIVVLIRNGTGPGKVILRALDIITIVVPPALPAAMTVGTVYAQSRLKKQGIFCISPGRINICGKLKCICFDKTGTLTADGLDMWGVVPCSDKHFQSPEKDPSLLSPTDHVQRAMASCHSLTLIEEELSGDPLDIIMFLSINWTLEEPGTDSTKFDSLVPTVVKPPSSLSHADKVQTGSYDVGIVRQFTFSSSLQRMSVITRTLGDDHMQVYSKGAPEKIASLCRPDTLPDDFVDVLHRYTVQGYRVLALSHRVLDSKLTWHQAQRIARDKVECDMDFIGLLIMANSLKPQTTPVIQQLNNANIRTIMVTGDNLLTAVSVARQCEMVDSNDRVVLVNAFPPENGKPASISWEYAEGETSEEGTATTSVTVLEVDQSQVTFSDYRDLDIVGLAAHDVNQTSVQVDFHAYHLAITGRSFSVLRQHFPHLIPQLIVKGTVYARMSPDQKAQLVEHLQQLDYCVGMCGDGANDCGALKAAHAGISLSEAEASVASPFTSKTANIECVPTVIREGRAALVTSFGVFKYMALYSMVQFISVLVLYSMETNLGDWMFLYIDLVITTTVAVLMGHTGAFAKLVAKRPPGSLLAVNNLFSIMVHIVIVCLGQTLAFLYLTTQAWYEAAVPSGDEENVNTVTQVTTVIFGVSSFQYLMLAFIFSKGAPYRQPIWHNIPFLVALLILTALTSCLLLYPPSFLVKLLGLVDLPSIIFRLTLLGGVAVHFLLSFSLESLIIPSTWFNKLVNKCRRKKEFKNKYKVIERDLAGDLAWPPVGTVTMATPQQS